MTKSTVTEDQTGNRRAELSLVILTLVAMVVLLAGYAVSFW